MHRCKRKSNLNVLNCAMELKWENNLLLIIWCLSYAFCFLLQEMERGEEAALACCKLILFLESACCAAATAALLSVIA